MSSGAVLPAAAHAPSRAAHATTPPWPRTRQQYSNERMHALGPRLAPHTVVHLRVQIEEMAAGKKLVVMINPQWTGGQIVSDFGIFGRKKKEAFVNSFTTTYSLQTKRMCGEDIRCAPPDATKCSTHPLEDTPQQAFNRACAVAGHGPVRAGR